MPKIWMKPLTVAAAISCTLVTTAHAAMTISNAKTKNVTCTSGVCTPTGGNANLNTGELQSMLASSDVTVKSSASAPSLGVLDPLTWASTHRLTLDSVQFIHIKAAVVVEGRAGLTLTINDGGTGGDLIFENGGYVNFWDLGSGLVIDGQSYKLVNGVPMLAGSIAANPSGNFALAKSYDASTHGSFRRTPIATVFKGTFEGLGNSISNLQIRTEKSDASLFAVSQGTLRDITLTNAIVGAVSGRVSVLVTQNSGIVAHVAAAGSTSSFGASGGIVALNNGTVVSSFFTGVATGRAAGGLVLDNRGTIISSSASAKVFASPSGARRPPSQAGGLVAVNSGLIEQSSATGDVGEATMSGGLVGLNQGSVTACHATGNIASAGNRRFQEMIGALIGSNAGSEQSPAIVSESYATGKVFAANKKHGAAAGGLVGYNSYAAISNSYATGLSEGKDIEAGGLVGLNDIGSTINQAYATGTVSAVARTGSISGGFIGVDGANPGKIASGYWDMDTSGIDNPHQGAGQPLDDPGITGLTDAQLKSALPAGFDPAVWGQDPNINNGWPYLLANPPEQAPVKKRTRK
jgi:hypothetical protein